MSGERAKVTQVWVGEIDPDTFSSYIQFRLSVLSLPGIMQGSLARWKYTIKFVWDIVCGRNPNYLIDFSHNATIFEGECWHGTTSDDEEYSGFCNEPLDRAFKDSVIRLCREVTTRFTREELRVYLHARKGTPYGMIRSNIANIHPWVLHIPFFGRKFWRTGKFVINCSEVSGEVSEGGTIDGCPDPLNFGDLDKCSPLVTRAVLKPQVCNHNHLTKTNS